MEKRFCTSTPIVPHNNNSNNRCKTRTGIWIGAVRCGARVSSYPARFHDWTTWLLMVLHRCQPLRHVRLHAETREGWGWQVCVPQPGSRLWSVKRREGRALPRGGATAVMPHTLCKARTHALKNARRRQTTLIKHVFFSPPTVLTAVSPPHTHTSLLLLFFVCFQIIWRVSVTHQTHLNSRWRVWRENSLFFF